MQDYDNIMHCVGHTISRTARKDLGYNRLTWNLLKITAECRLWCVFKLLSAYDQIQ